MFVKRLFATSIFATIVVLAIVVRLQFVEITRLKQANQSMVAERDAARAQRNLNDGQPLDTEQLLRARSLLAGQDMPDKVKACLLKVVGHALRQDGTLTPVRVREAALNAMHEVNTRLAVWHRAQERAGTLALDAVPAEPGLIKRRQKEKALFESRE